MSAKKRGTGGYGAAAVLAFVAGAALACQAPESLAAPVPLACPGTTPASLRGTVPVDTSAPPGPAGSRPAPVLRLVEDVPLPGPAVRFDYQSLDPTTGRLYIAHMNAGTLLVFDTRTRRVVADLPGFPSVHGVRAVPDLGRVYAAVTGRKQVAVLDAGSLEVLARVGPIGYPDGIAYAPDSKRVFVSDESRAGEELVIDALSGVVVGRVALDGEAGNTVYDPGSHCILVAVQTRNEVVAIDPGSDSIVGRYRLPGARHPHGLSLDAQRRLLFVANEANATLLVVDLDTMRVLSSHRVGEDPDVLAFDPALKRLYVASESGTVTIFEVQGRDLVEAGSVRMPHAHTVAVDPATHLVYFPLQDLDGGPVLRIMAP